MKRRVERYGWKVTHPTRPERCHEGKRFTLETAKKEAFLAAGADGTLGISKVEVLHDNRPILEWRDGKWVIVAWENRPKGQGG